VLVYSTEPLKEDVEVTGRIRAVLHAATDAPSTDWVVRLCDVDLWSTSHVFRAGHRIRVQVTSSNFPRWARNLNTGEPVEDGTHTRIAQQQIAHDAARPSRIILPVIPHPSA